MGNYKFENFKNEHTVKDNKNLDFTRLLPTADWNAIKGSRKFF